MSITYLTVAAGLAWALATPPPARAQADTARVAPLQAGIALYASAAYDDALAAFDVASQIDLARDDRVALDQHRWLCLLALGRTAAADDAAARLLEARPDFVLAASDVSPRMHAMFEQARRRVLPTVVRRVYTEAKRAYDRGDYTEARAGFSQLTTMLADPAVAASDPSFTDLGTLIDGFLHLASAAIDRRSARRDSEIVQSALAVLTPARPVHTPVVSLAAAVTPSPALSAPAARDAEPGAAEPLAQSAPTEAIRPTSNTVAPRPFAPLGIFTFDWRDKDVSPPTVVSQPVSGWWGSMGEPAAGTPLGVIEVVVDEAGQVSDARIYRSVNRVYDAVLLESARQWRYQPAMKDGRAVKYRRISGVVSGR